MSGSRNHPVPGTGSPIPHANRGRELELAIRHAAAAYLRSGRLRQFQAAHVRIVDGQRREKGGLDFNCVLRDGRALHLEAKETHEVSLPLAKVRPHQQRLLQELGDASVLVAWFAIPNETYSIPGDALTPLLANPWRDSITLDMARAWGLLLPRMRQDARSGSARGKGALAMFLDGLAHPARDQAHAQMEHDRATCEARMPAREEREQQKLDAKSEEANRRDREANARLPGETGQEKHDRLVREHKQRIAQAMDRFSSRNKGRTKGWY